MNVSQEWALRLRECLPAEFARSEVLQACTKTAPILLHGSTARGVDDALADLDVWILTDADSIAKIDAAFATRFFEFKIDGKPGHFNFENLASFAERMRHCDFELISELRDAILLQDSAGAGERVLQVARKTMREEVRRAWACYHYVEMRGEHKAMRNPIERGDALATLQSVARTLSHAMKAAMVIDSTPYPYVKWLAHAARKTPTGAAVMRSADEMLNLLAQDVLRLQCPSDKHPLTETMWAIRKTLIAALQENEIHGPWIDQWWLHLTSAREAISNIEW